MNVLIDYEYREKDMKELLDIGQLARYIIQSEGKPENTEVSIKFVSNDVIHALNSKWRHVNSPTDVLSFECDTINDTFPNDALMASQEVIFELGDIVIAPDVAEAQARDYGLSFADEISLLVTHGLLHLCGYDHEKDEDAHHMETRERTLLSSFWGRDFKRSEWERK